MLKKSARDRLRARFERLEAEQARCRITFARVVSGHLDKDDNPIPSRAKLFARHYVAEIEAKAEASPGFKRRREDRRSKATADYVRERAGAAYTPKAKPHKSTAVTISHNLKAARGMLAKTLERMRSRSDTEQNCLLALCEILPSELIEFIRSAPTSLIDKYMRGVESAEFSPAWFPDGDGEQELECENRPPVKRPKLQPMQQMTMHKILVLCSRWMILCRPKPTRKQSKYGMA